MILFPLLVVLSRRASRAAVSVVAGAALLGVLVACSTAGGPQPSPAPLKVALGSASGGGTLRGAAKPDGDIVSLTLYVSEVALAGDGVPAEPLAQYPTPEPVELFGLGDDLVILADAVLPAGDYGKVQLRLILDRAELSVALPEGGTETFVLKTPSGAQSGLKVNTELALEVDAVYGVTLALLFDPDASIVVRGAAEPDRYLLKPVVRGEVAANARVRVVHAVADAPPLGIRAGGAELVAGLGYGESSGYRLVPSGDRQFALTAGAGEPPLYAGSFGLAPAGDYTLIASGLVSGGFDVAPTLYRDTPPALGGEAGLRVLHHSTGLAKTAPGGVDVFVTAPADPLAAPLVEGLGFGEPAPESAAYLPLPAGAYRLRLTAAGDGAVVVDSDPDAHPLAAAAYSLIVVGDADAGHPPEFLLLPD